jgi:hypothetical protein
MDGNNMTPKKKVIDNEQINTFILAFMGEYINVITDIMILDYAQNDSQSLEQNAPMVARGFLLDEDEHFLYLGDNPLEISQAIAKNKVAMIHMEKKKNKYDELLDEMGDEPSKEDIN